jgi:hypothetical protein
MINAKGSWFKNSRSFYLNFFFAFYFT